MGRASGDTGVGATQCAGAQGERDSSARRKRQRRATYARARWAALEPIRQGVRAHCGAYQPKVALGVGRRMDWGPQYTAHPFLGELAWPGIRASPSYGGEPECNGCIERWIRTLTAECLYLDDFADLEEARRVIGAFVERLNREWLLARHGDQTPAAVRARALDTAA